MSSWTHCRLDRFVADIATASAEQSTGLDEINKALTQMDDVTQQNSALVEENAATAKTLEHQAKTMDEQVAYFQIGDVDHNQASPAINEEIEKPAIKPKAIAPKVHPAPRPQPKVAPKRVAAASNGGGPVGRMHAALATAVASEPDW